jgi:hypothetical protein
MAESAPRHHWVCTDISQALDHHQNRQALTEMVRASLAAPGLYLLYCFSEHILPDRFSPGRAAIDLTRVLQEQLEGQALAPEPIDENELPSLADDAIRLFLYAPDNPDGEPCQAAFAHFRERLTRPLEHPLFMLVSAGVYDGLRAPWVTSLALSDPNVHEVLLWDAGELRADQISDPEAWCGSGWIGPRCRDVERIQDRRFPLDQLAAAFHQGLDSLIRLTRDPTRPQADRHGRKDAYLSALSRFLPPLRGAGGLLIPATVGSWGGPRPWTAHRGRSVRPGAPPAARRLALAQGR